MRHTTLRRASSRQIPRTNKLPRKAPAQRRGLAWHVDAINVSLSVLDPVSGFLKHFTTSNRGPVGLNWGWYENKEIDALAVKVQATFDEAERTRLLQKMHEMVVADGGRIFIVHDLNPRALSPRLKGFVQAQSWFQDMTPIVVTATTN